MTIYLVGLPACGKTTIGKEVSRALSISFLDADEELEKEKGMFIPEMFRQYGEAAFRQWETDFLVHTRPREHTIISLGGGVVLKKENRDILKKETVLFIDPTISYSLTNEELAQRPVMKEKSLSQLKMERQALYEEIATVLIQESTMEKAILKTMEEVKRLCGI